MSELSEKKVAWIAITGIMGSGKSTCIAELKKWGYSVLNCDEIAASLLKKDSEAYPLIVDLLGKTVVDEDGGLNRKKIADLIFHDEKLKGDYEALLHPLILKKLEEQRLHCDDAFQFVEVPLLFEIGWQKYFDQIWVISADMKTIEKRLIYGRGFSISEIKERLATQISLDKKKALCDVWINNDVFEDTLIQLRKGCKECERIYGKKRNNDNSSGKSVE